MTEKEYEVEGRLRIRPITMDDTEYIVDWRNKDHVRMNFLFREWFTPQMHENWMREKVVPGFVEQFIVEELPEGRPIGSVYFRDIEPEKGQAEYGVFLGEEDALGKGYGNLIANWAVDFAREELRLTKLILRVLSDNRAAVMSYQNAGYTEKEYKPQYLTDEKGQRDLIIMERNL